MVMGKSYFLMDQRKKAILRIICILGHCQKDNQGSKIVHLKANIKKEPVFQLIKEGLDPHKTQVLNSNQANMKRMYRG